ncbi:hypothetical protein EVAR_101182_1 [Eumeta japonica]|uniref:Uncharacterized protein n=1 Tax=Eumeta variegata TaxID=151549 RepID=A0A4C1SL49_EUMVA|nr:hypothetical protein EVAR_101182_1 [Eumeta japonica]
MQDSRGRRHANTAFVTVSIEPTRRRLKERNQIWVDARFVRNNPASEVRVASFNYGVHGHLPAPSSDADYHIVSKYCQDESNEPKLDWVASFNYGVPMATSFHPSDADYHIVSKYSSRRIKRAQTRWGCV